MILIIGTTLYGCSRGSEEKPDRVVLVTIDTLRADHVGAYGYPLDITPFIDSLARSGVGFSRALSHASATAPSHASIFTGLFPIQHGVDANGLKLWEGFNTLAEAFREAGYQTAAFTSTNAHFKWGNMHQGFDYYNEQALADSKRPRRDKKQDPYRPANETIDAALEWLNDASSSDKLFLWIHLYDPHKKLKPPQPEREEVARLVEGLGRKQHKEALQAAHGDPGFRKLYRKVLLYDAEILFVDRQLERLYRAMDSPDSNDLWIITSDHGQGLYSHESWFGHSKQIYNTQILVPLIMHYTHAESEPVWIEDAVVQHIDLVPTLSELVGFEISQPDSSLQGRSLVPYLTGTPPRATPGQSFAQNSRHRGRSKRRPTLSGPRYSLQNLEFKYILNEFEDDEFFDLRVDPNERLNQLDTEEMADDRDRLLGTLVRMMDTLSNTEIEVESVDEATLERLKALGYLQ